MGYIKSKTLRKFPIRLPKKRFLEKPPLMRSNPKSVPLRPVPKPTIPILPSKAHVEKEVSDGNDEEAEDKEDDSDGSIDKNDDDDENDEVDDIKISQSGN